MSCPAYRHHHFALVPWRQAEIPDQDFLPASGEMHRDTRSAFGRGERQYALPVEGQSGVCCGPELGMLAIRCTRHGELVIPEKIAIADLGPQCFNDEAA